MSRLYRSLQPILRSSRLAPRLSSGQVVRIERVKLRKAKPRTRFLGYMIKGALIYHFLLFVLVGPADETELDGNDDSEESLFIPFPFTTKRVEPQPYPKGGPEAEEFARIQKKTPEFHKRLARVVIELAVKDAAQRPAFVLKHGKMVRANLVRVSLVFPAKGPPTYERSGILITDEAVEWASVPMESSTAKLLDRVLWPRPAFMASWVLIKTLAKQKASEFATFIGFSSDESRDGQVRSKTALETSLPTPRSPEVQKAIERIRQQARGRPEEVNDSSSMSSSTAAAPATPSVPRGEGTRPSGNQPLDQSNEKGPDKRRPVEESIRRFSENSAWQAFKETWAELREPLVPDPPRGSILIRGTVDLETTRAWLDLEIEAWYDPKRNVAGPVAARIRRRFIKSQR